MDLKVEAQSVQALAVRNMRDAIIAGHFQPGDRLVESDMCTRLGISRPSLREALRSLEAEKLIIMIPNRGPMIPILTIDEARDLYDVRALLEGEAVALFTERADKAALLTMRTALAAFDEGIERQHLATLLETTRNFYQPILSGCGNKIIEEMLNSLMARITFVRSTSMSLSGRAQKSSKEMRAILKAIAAQNPQAAREAAVKHVREACEAAMVAYAASRLGPLTDIPS